MEFDDIPKIILCPACKGELALGSHGAYYAASECICGAEFHIEQNYENNEPYVFAVTGRKKTTSQHGWIWRIMIREGGVRGWLSVDEEENLEEVNNKIKQRFQSWKMIKALGG